MDEITDKILQKLSITTYTVFKKQGKISTHHEEHIYTVLKIR